MSTGNFELNAGTRLHLIGVGGSGMSAIAHVLLDRGYEISGSDLQENESIRSLRERGAIVKIGHAKENINGADALVISSAIPAENPELVAARDAGLPVLKRADFLRYLMAEQSVIAVAGTHGKTYFYPHQMSLIGSMISASVQPRSPYFSSLPKRSFW